MPTTPNDKAEFDIAKPNLEDRVAPTGVISSYRGLQDIPAATLNVLRSDIRTASAYSGWVLRPEYWDVLDEMGQDATIQQCIQTRAARVLALPTVLEYADEADRTKAKADDILAFVAHVTAQPEFFAMVNTLAENMLLHGRATFEVVWEQDGATILPAEYHHLHPGRICFDEQNNPQVFAGRYGTTDNALYIVPGKFITAPYRLRYGNPYGHGVVIDRGRDWWYKHRALKDKALFVSVNGQPITVVTMRRTSAGSMDQRQTQLVQAIQSLESGIGLVLMDDEEVKIHDRSGGASGVSGATVHDSLISYYDNAIRSAILGANLAAESGTHGARSLGEVHETTENIRNQTLANALEIAINDWLLKPLVYFNYGIAASVPTLSYNLTKGLGQDEAESLIKIAHDTGVPLPLRFVLESLSVPAPQPGELVLVNGTVIQYQEPGTATPAQSNSAGTWTSEMFAASRDRGIKYAKRFTDIRGKIADAASRDGQALMYQMAKGLRRGVAEQGMIANAAFSAVYPREASLQLSRQICFSNGLLQMWSGAVDLKYVRLNKPPERFADQADLDNMPEEFREAAEWMEQRGIMTKTQLLEMASAIAAEQGIDAVAAAQELRRYTLALTDKIGQSATAAIRDVLAQNINNGSTATDFLLRLDSQLDKNLLPGDLDAYWNTVYRTETMNSYGASGELIDDMPDVQDHMWGKEGYNPRDGRSRETHAAIKGVRFKKGSQAYNSLGAAPFSYNCRCSAFRLMTPDPANHNYVESAQALAVALAIRKF